MKTPMKTPLKQTNKTCKSSFDISNKDDVMKVKKEFDLGAGVCKKKERETRKRQCIISYFRRK